MNSRPFVMMWLQTELEKILKLEKRIIPGIKSLIQCVLL